MQRALRGGIIPRKWRVNLLVNRIKPRRCWCRVCAFGVTRGNASLLRSFLNGCYFLFRTFCLETKGGAKSSSRFNSHDALNPKAASYESALCSTLNLDGL